MGEETKDLNPLFYDEQQDDAFQTPPVVDEEVEEIPLVEAPKFDTKMSEATSQSQLQTVNNSRVDPRDIAILNYKINDPSQQNKPLITDVVPSLVNTSKTESANLFNQMNKY